jgi:hypothetical protein
MTKPSNSRRSILNTSVGETPGCQTGEMDSPTVKAASIDFLSTLRMPAIRQRKRQWEQQFKTKTYRGVSPQAHAAVKKAASEQGCSIDQAATAFLEYALYCHQRGDKNPSLEPVLRSGRWTLFPNSETTQSTPRIKVGWTERIWDLKPPNSMPKSNKIPANPALVKPWRDWPWVGYRLPGSVVLAVDRLRIDMMVPAGEVVTLLLGHAFQAYCTGRLVLTSNPFNPEDR